MYIKMHNKCIPHSEDIYLQQNTGVCNFGMGRPSLTHGRYGELGTASGGGGPACAAAAVSLQGWPADVSSVADAAAAAAAA